MAYTVIESPQFVRDYDSILEYLMLEVKSPAAAMNLIDEMDEVIATLEDNPYINALSRKSALESMDLREHYLSRYVVLYVVLDSRTVELNRMFHQSQDYERFFYRSSL